MKRVPEHKNAVPGAGTSKNGRSSEEPTNTPLLSGFGKDLSSMENTGYRFLTSVEDIQFRMSCGIDTIVAVHELMDGAGASTAESYTDALYCAYDYLRMLNNQLQEAANEARAESKVAK